MTKLSAPQDKAIRALTNGEFPMGTNKRTIDALVNNGYVTEDNTFYDLTEKGRKYLGIQDAVSEIIELLDSPITDAERVILPAGWDNARFADRNRVVWQGLTEDEINADIATARPVANRKDVRSGNVLKSKFA